MKINYVLLYGTPYLKYKLFDTFEKMSDFIVKRSIVNYTIFEKMEDKKEVEMIYRDNDIRVLEKRINKALELLDSYKLGKYDYALTPAGLLELEDILRGENNDSKRNV